MQVPRQVANVASHPRAQFGSGSRVGHDCTTRNCSLGLGAASHSAFSVPRHATSAPLLPALQASTHRRVRSAAMFVGRGPGQSASIGIPRRLAAHVFTATSQLATEHHGSDPLARGDRQHQRRQSSRITHASSSVVNFGIPVTFTACAPQ